MTDDDKTVDTLTGEAVQDTGVLIGRSPAMQTLYRDMARVAQTDLPVLISGESGTGKELVARAIHMNGNRRRDPFVSVNMAAIPCDLVESELFGQEEGGHSGAGRRSKGRFEEADNGTLFLDEIGHTPLAMQTRLLRVLQNGEYRSIGDHKSRKSRVRIIAATNRELRPMIKAGTFREDLFYRLSVVPLAIPPLRQRMEDLPHLTRYFLALAQKKGLGQSALSPAAMKRLARHLWPGNVRELENLIMRLTALADSPQITEADIDTALSVNSVSGTDGSSTERGLGDIISDHLDQYFDMHGDTLPPSGLYGRMVRELERPLIHKVLALTKGNQVRAAQILGLNRNTLRQRIKDLNISIVKYPDA